MWGAGGAGKGDERAPHKEEKRVGGVPTEPAREMSRHPTEKKSELVGCRKTDGVVA